MADENQTRVPAAVITVAQPPSVQLRQALVHQMAMGVYPPGSKLPSVRQLAENLGINRNTVSKVYQQLAREKLVRAVPGKGVFVVATRVRVVEENSVREQVVQSVAAVSRQARLYGLDRSELLDLILQAVERVYQRQTVSLAFVECNIHDTKELARDLQFYLNLEVHPLLLADVATHGSSHARGFDLICTTFYHLTELRQLIPDLADRIVALQVTPRPEVLLQLARYGAEHRLGLVVSNQRTLDSLITVVHTASDAAVEAAFTSDEQAVKGLGQRADAIIDTLGSHAAAVRLIPHKPKITVTYHADNQSLEYLRHRILQCLQQGETR